MTTPSDSKPIIPEAHARLLEKIRLLERQDPAFAYLANVISDRLDLMVNRGNQYGHIRQTVYFEGDASAKILFTVKCQKLRFVAKNGDYFHSDATLLDSLQDAVNYGDIWLCGREQYKHEGK